MVRVSEPAEIVKLSPMATRRATARSSEPRNVPADEASQKETCEYVSAFGTFVQATLPEVVREPPDAAEKVACVRVVFAAGLPAPAAPGSPRCNLTQKAAGCVQVTLRQSAFN